MWAKGFGCLLSALCSHGKWLLSSDGYNFIHVYEIATKRHLHTIPLLLQCTDLCGSITSPHALIRYVDGSMSLINILVGEVVQQFSDPGGGRSDYVLGCSLGGRGESLVLQGGEGEQAIYPFILFLPSFSRMTQMAPSLCSIGKLASLWCG